MVTVNRLLPTTCDEVVLMVVEDFVEWVDEGGSRSKYDPHRVQVPCKFITVQDGLVWVTIDGGSVGFPVSKVEINYLPKSDSSDEVRDI